MLLAPLAGEGVGTNTFEACSFSIYFSSFNSTLDGHFTGYVFMDFKTGNLFYGFSVNSVCFLCWHAGSCLILSSGFRRISVMYIYDMSPVVFAGCWLLLVFVYIVSCSVSLLK